MEQRIILIGNQSSDYFNTNYKQLSDKGKVEVLIYTSLLALLHLQTRLDSSSYNAITDNVYGNLITEIRKHKPEMDANSIGDFVEKRFQVLLPEIQIITEGLGHAIPATIYSLFYKAPLAEHINTEVPNLIEIVPFTKTLLEVTNNVIGQYEKL